MTDRQSSAKEYARQRRYLAIAMLIVGTVYLVMMILRGSAGLKNCASALADTRWIVVMLYVLGFVLLYEIVTLPLSYYGGFYIEYRYNLSSQSLRSWAWRELKRFLLSLVLLVPIVEVIYFFLARFPERWWLLASGVWILFTALLTRVAPVLILPLFYRQDPVKNESLEQLLQGLAAGTGLGIREVFRLNMSKETKKANAALAGLGRTRRVLLSDTLLDGFSDSEIGIVFAHELGHHVFHHITKAIVVSSVAALVGFALAHQVMLALVGPLGFEGVGDIAAFPLLCLVLSAFGLLILPIQNAYSRKLERDCDAYALKRTGQPQAFIAAMERLGSLNLADRNPSRFVEILFHDHPPIGKRIAMAEAMLKRDG